MDAKKLLTIVSIALLLSGCGKKIEEAGNDISPAAASNTILSDEAPILEETLSS